jgi:hypothetical protein
MAKNTLETIDVGNFTLYGGGVHVCGVKYAEAGGCVILVAFLNCQSRGNVMVHTFGAYGAASFLNAVAGIALSLMGISILWPVRLSVTFQVSNY